MLNPKGKMRESFSIKCFRISEKTFDIGRFPGFAPVSFWEEYHVDGDGCGAMVEWY
jgi:hypothetical protein